MYTHKEEEKYDIIIDLIPMSFVVPSTVVVGFAGAPRTVALMLPFQLVESAMVAGRLRRNR